MRLKPGRPDLSRYAARFDVPAASGPLGVTFLGVTSLLLDDGESAVLTDGFFSRPSLARVALGRISPDVDRIDAALGRAGVDRLEAVLPVHTHYDHAMDSAAVAHRTGAVLVGGTSTAHVGRGGGLPEDRIRVAVPGEAMAYGGWTLTLVESHHCPPDRYPGVITEPVVPPVRTGAYRCGEAWSILVAHASGRTALLQGSAGFVPGSLAGHRADVAYLGVGQLGVQPEEYVRAYWAETVEAVGARRVVLTHWDDFFRPLDRPLRALPYAGDDLDVTMRVLGGLAAEQGVALHLPTLWRREDPWADLPTVDRGDGEVAP
ncbi:MBL fold metallo-hydrolase [Nocardioides lijunqiniae]|uniref:MBL fold metallo-hydrolase n=1 Tax=Nocardioides lijunqiniae TaxID=2760832 RepID=UPI001878FCA2|nr:MBL fold metallo-hydrolase [Nocardioides lijunqiniae]